MITGSPSFAYWASAAAVLTVRRSVLRITKAHRPVRLLHKLKKKQQLDEAGNCLKKGSHRHILSKTMWISWLHQVLDKKEFTSIRKVWIAI
jgi:hypothetical protein